MAPPTQAAAFCMLLLLLLAATSGCAGRFVVFEPSPFTPQQGRQLQQAPSNCTPPRTFQDTERPFCFQPDTVSAEAKQFLSNSSAGFFGDFGTALASGDPATAAAALQQARASYQQLSTPLHEAAVAQYLQSVSNSSIGGVPVVIGVPKGVNNTDPANTRVLLYLHGGGYVVGSCQWLLNTVAVTAATAGLTIICPEYRLAPEHPFPAGLNDILSVYKAMIKSEEGGYNPKNIVLLGDSAGGGAVAAAAIQLQREGEPLQAALGMFSPWVDLATRGDTAVTLNAVDPVVPGRNPFDPQASGNGLALSYVGGVKALLTSDPLVSPVIADWATLFPGGGALPPTLIQVGLRETLLSDSVRLYQGMRQAAPALSGRVVLSPYEGMWHVFQGYVFVPEAVAAGKEMGGFFKAVLDGQVCE